VEEYRSEGTLTADQLAEALDALFPLWEIWRIYRAVGGILWCARLKTEIKQVINEGTAERLAGKMYRYEVSHGLDESKH
jgi:hypothetical protein